MTLLITGPIVLLIGLESIDSARLDGVTHQAKPVLISPEHRTLTGERPVRLQISWVEGTEVLAPDWHGLVTKVLIAIGDSVMTGTSVVEVDGIPRIAAATDRPFYRALKLGDEGEDVLALNSLLIRLGYLDEGDASASFDADTARAMFQWQTLLGYQDADTSFHPEMVAWLPDEPLVVAELRAVAGAPAPGAGSPLFVSKGSIASALLEPADSRGPDLTFDPGEHWLLSVDGLELPIGDEPALDESTRQALARSLTTEATSLLGSVRLESAVSVTAIPSSSVMTGATGQLCVWVEGADGFHARAVEIGDSARGTSFVRTGLNGDERVLANTAQILEDPSCPSN